RNPLTKKRLILLLAGVGLASGIAWLLVDRQRAYPDVSGAHYIGSQRCAECHAQQFAEWKGSDHEQAMQPATPETVLGNFKNAEFTWQGVRTRFTTRDGKYFIETEGPDGKIAEFPVEYTFGVRPLQQYMTTLPGGRVQVF